MLKNSFKQAIQQKLSPQAIQAQLLLAVPAIALEQEIKKQLEENIVLEEDNDVNIENSSAIDSDNSIDINNWNDYPLRSNYISNFQGTDEERTDYLINKLDKSSETPLEQIYKMGDRKSVV